MENRAALHSELRRLLHQKPGIFLRLGPLLLLLSLLGLWALAYFLPYPETLRGRITISTATPPQSVSMVSAGRIAHLGAGEGDTVRRGDLLLVIENLADTEDMLLLDSLLEGIAEATSEQLARVYVPTGLQAGDLEQYYNNVLAYQEQLGWRQGLAATDGELASSEARRLASIEERLKVLKEEMGGLELKKAKELQQLSEAQLKYDQTTIPLSALKEARNAYQEVVNAIFTKQAAIKDLELQIEEIKASRLDRTGQGLRGQRDSYFGIKSSLMRLHSALQSWKQAHLVFAPVSGRVSYYKFRKVGEYIEANERLLAIEPLNGGQVEGQLLLPIAGAGKVAPGQDVLIRLDAYPHRDYGLLKGQVQTIALLPDDQLYSVQVSLPQGLRSETGKMLKFRLDLVGDAEVVTRRRRFMAYVWEHF